MAAALRGLRRLSTRKCTCRLCNIEFDNRRHLWEHKQIHHRSEQIGAGPPLQDVPWGPDDNNPFDITADPAGLELGTEYGLNENQILQPHNRTVSRVYEYFNFPLVGAITDDQIRAQMTHIFNLQQNSYKLNLSPGILLRHRVTGEIRYFSPSLGTSIFPNPILIRTRDDLERAIQQIQDAQIANNLNRPTSAWEARFLTQVKYYVYKLRRPLGNLDIVTLPHYIMSNRSICTTLESHTHKQAHVEDSLCIFVALAQYRKLKSGCPRWRLRYVKADVASLFQKWCMFAINKGIMAKYECNFKDFQGVDVKYLPYFEECFEICVNMYSLTDSNEAYTTYLTRSDKIYSETLMLNVFETHVNLIYDLNFYCRSHLCHICGRSFVKPYRLKIHLPTCGMKTKYTFPGSYKRNYKHLFERLRELNFDIDHNFETLFSPYFCTWDLESALEPCDITSESGNLSFTNVHKPIAAGVCSNIPGFEEAHIIVHKDPYELTCLMLKYMEQVRVRMSELLTLKYSNILMQLDCFIEARRHTLIESNIETSITDDLNELVETEIGLEYDIEDDLSADDNALPGSGRPAFTCRDVYLQTLLKMKRELNTYINVLPCLSYNGSRYDLAILQIQLAKIFHTASKEDDGEIHVLKKGNSYLCISNNKLRFLDMLQFLGHTMSYAQFLKLVGTEESKGFFPYEAVDSYESLFTTGLPPYPSSVWFDSLSGYDMLDKCHEIWRLAGDSSVKEPATGSQNYQELLTLWENEGWTCLYNLLCYYLSRDVKPFCSAISSFLDIWFNEQIDVFHSCVSLASLANIAMWKQSVQDNIVFPLWPAHHKHLYYLTKNSLCGGASLVFNRYQRVGCTKLKKGSDKITQSIQGRDVCSLYMHALSGRVPTQNYVWRSAEDGFKPQLNKRLHLMFIWLQYMEKIMECKITSAQSHGYDCKVLGYYPDGYSLLRDPNTGEMQSYLFEFDGCVAHSCKKLNCRVLKHCTFVPDPSRAERTERKRREMEDLGYKVISIAQCDFLDIVDNDPDLQFELNKFYPPFYQKYKYSVSEDVILKSIADGLLFGFVLCSVRCYAEYIHLYDDFPVLFGSTILNYEDLAPCMKEYMQENNITYKPRKLLISANSAEGILLSSDYVQWIIQSQHFHVTVEQIIEFVPNTAFDRYIDNIATLRRTAQSDPSTAALGAVMKLVGNASYGGLCKRLETMHNFKYIHGSHAAALCINDSKFISLVNLTENYFEFIFAKSRLQLNTLNYLANWVTLQGKLHVLKYIYNFLYVWLDKSCISLVTLDTDGLYCSFSESSMDKIVKPQLQDSYNKELYGRCGEAPYKDIYKFLLPRLCCHKCETWDNFTPGLVKIEFSAQLIVAICSKTYYLESFDTHVRKLGTKGLQKKQLVNNPNIREAFINTIIHKKPFYSTNKGFRFSSGFVYSYVQSKLGWQYLYFKRHLCNQGIYTTGLPIVLRPHPTKVLFIQTEGKCLSSDHKFPFHVRNVLFTTIMQAFVYFLAKHYNQIDLLEIIMDSTCSRTLSDIYCTEISSLCTNEVRDMIIREIVASKYMVFEGARAQLSANTFPTIINADLNKYLGVGECYAVLRWVDVDFMFKGGRNMLSVAWQEAHAQACTNGGMNEGRA